MKKFTAFILTAALFLTLSIPLSAESADIRQAVALGKKYLEENAKEAVTFDDTLSFAEAGIINDTMKIYSVKADENDAQTLAEYILLQRAFGLSVKISEDGSEDYGDRLIKLQKENGSFGDVKATVFAVGALLALEKKPDKSAENYYDDAAAVNYIISEQKEDGSIGDVETSVKAAAVLKCYESSPSALDAVGKLETYLIQAAESGDISISAYALTGLTDINYGNTTPEMENLIKRITELQNEDGGFAKEKGQASDTEFSKIAFSALESVRYTVSPFNAVVKKDSFNKKGFDFSELKPLAFLYGGLALCSVAMWVFIFKRKPRAGTLEDSKEASAKRLEKVQKLEEENENEE